MGMENEIIISVVLLVVGVGVLVIIHVCIVGRAFNRESDDNIGDNILAPRRSSNRSDGGSVKPMSKDDLQKLPCFDYVDAEDNTNPMACVVCLENFIVGDHCRLLPNCEHRFHAECIDPWLLEASVCPICRSSVTLAKVEIPLCEGSGFPLDIVV